MSTPQQPIPTLDIVQDTAWRILSRGAVDRKDPAQAPTLVTQGSEYPAGRTVILRRVDRKERSLICHTDIRAKKVAEIRKNPFVSWHLWHPKRRVQLRMFAQAALQHDDDFARQEWQRVSPASRLNYSATVAPGTFVSSVEASQAPYTPFEELSEGDTDLWYPNFCVIHTQVVHWEYLQLKRGGNIRASFEWQNEAWQGNWMVI